MIQTAINRTAQPARGRSTTNASGKGCALVTGGAGGIGSAIVRALSEAGWPVGINFWHSEDAAVRTGALVERNGGRQRVVRADIRDQAEVNTLFDTLEAEFGHVAVLVNNAGVRLDGLLMATNRAEWANTLDANLTAAYSTMWRALPSMIEHGFGRIINITSILAERSIPGTAAYTAAKSGLEGLTRSVAVEVARKGVTVNAVAPGLVRSQFTENVDHLNRSVQDCVPMRRLGEPDEIAACVAFLASDGASYITGATIHADGGLSATAFPIR